MFRPVRVRQYLKFMEAKGYPATAVLAGSGVTTQSLAEASCLIDNPQYRAITNNILSLTGDNGIGLEFGEKTELMDLGTLGFLVMSAKTVRQTSLYWSNYSPELEGVLVRQQLVGERSSGAWTLELSEITPLGRILHFCVEEQLMMIYRLAGKLTSSESTLELVELSYPKPPHYELYEQYFETRVKFGAPKTQITILKPGIDFPLVGNDQEFHEVCSRQCEQMMRKIHEKDSTISKTKIALMRLKDCNPGIETVASQFNISARTLRRHLLDEGYSYQQLVDEYRAELAQEYFSSGSISPKEVGYLLGFKHATSFHRAFKRWTGASINGYRAKQNQSL